MSLRNYNVTKLSFSKRYFLLPIILIVFFLLFYLVYSDIKDKTINEFNKEQLIIAQAASQGITSFFQNYQNELTFLSQNNSITDFNDDSRALMDGFFNNHKNFIEAVTRVDAQGKILYTSPFNKSVIGQDISFQKHVHQILTTHQPVISDVFMAVQGYLAVALHVPVFKGNEFKGSLAILIQIDKLGKLYFEKIKDRGTSQTWLLSENGIEIYCPIKGHKGNSLIEIAQNDSSAIGLMDKLKKENEGTTKSIHPEKSVDGHDKFIEKYIAFYRVPLGNTYWTILISYNEEEIYAELNSFRNRLIIIFSFLFIVMAYYFYSITKVRAVLKEETKRKEAEKTLNESEEIFRRFMDHSPIYVFFKDENIRSLRLSKNYETMLGKPVDELLGKNMDELFPSDLAKKMVEDDRRILKEGKEIIVEEEFNGRFYSTIKFPIFIDGKPRYLAGYTIDITERKNSEEALKQANLVVENSPAVLFRWKAEEGWPVTFVSQNIVQFGYSSDELLTGSTPYASIIYPEDLERVSHEVNSKTNLGIDRFQQEYRILRKDGTICWVDDRTMVERNKEGQVTHYQGIVFDITERKQTEKALQQLSIDQANLLEISKSLNTSLEVKTILQTIIDKSTSLLGLDTGAIYTIKGDELYLGAATPAISPDFPEEFRRALIVDHPNIQKAISSCKPHILPDMAVANLSPAEQVIKESRDMRTLIYVPLLINKRAVGILILGTVKETRSFSETEINLYASISNQVALAIENAHLFDESQHYIIELKKSILVREQAEKALLESENNFRNVIEEAVEVVFTINNKGYFTYVNPAGVKSSGYSLDELRKLKYIDLIQEEYKLKVNLNYFRQFKERKLLSTTEYPFRKKSGEIKWFNQNARLITENDDIKGFYVIARDVTERRKAEEALRESEEKYRLIVENSHDGIEITQDDMIIYSNNQFAEMLGYTPEEIKEIKFIQIFSEQGIKELQEREKKRGYGELGSPHQYETTFVKKDGAIINVNVNYEIIEYNGKPATFATIQDITERKRAEQIRQKLSMAIRNSHEVIFMTDKEGIITYINPAFTKMYGYTDEEVVGKTTPRIIKSGALTREQNKQIWKTLLNKQSIPAVEYVNKSKDGKLIEIEGSAEPILDEKGEIIGFLGIQRDVTERKRSEMELIEAKELAEQSNKLKDAFIANMSHEIRTPLNGILGLSSIVKSLYAEHIKEEDESIFDGIDHSSKRLIRTVDMILNYSRIQTGEFPISPIEIELSLICENLVKEFAIKAKSKSLELTFENKFDRGITIFGDEYSITHSISNLLDNAIKYTEKGFIKIVLYNGNNDKIMMDIKDSGIGISKEYLSHAFEPYQQEHLGYGRAYEGVGLGLSMVKRFLNLNNADISVESEKGKGSTFTIDFGKALQASAKKVTEKKTDKLIDGQKTRNKPLILLVEDDVFNQAAIKIFVEKSYDTLITDNSEEALDNMKNNRVDLILMDISIKGSKNGLELTKTFKASKEYSHIPIIAITAHAFEADKHNALQAGCDDYLSKPFSKSLLLETISKFV